MNVLNRIIDFSLRNRLLVIAVRWPPRSSA